MKSRLATAFVTAILIGVGVGRLLAQEPAENPLEKLSWLVGGKWVADIKSPKGEPRTVETTMEWTGHKKALKYAVVFMSKEGAAPQYEGMYWWNPTKKGISLLQIDRAGNVTEALVTIEGDKWTQQNTLTRLDGTKQEQRAQFVRENEDTFSFKAFVPKGAEWVEAIGFKYRRVRDGASGKRP
jgi:hypothetical protein